MTAVPDMVKIYGDAKRFPEYGHLLDVAAGASILTTTTYHVAQESCDRTTPNVGHAVLMLELFLTQRPELCCLI
jgi:hypothetical protein